MCGIAGFQNKTPQPFVQSLARMLSSIEHRGPDAEGHFFSTDGTTALGHRRLSILDVSERGNQPMFSEDKRYVIVYNGEIYNFQEIRCELINLGYQFHTGTDTEVIITAYIHWGTDCFSIFNGMFAFALYDTHTNKLLIVRDSLGIKPLYYYADKNGIVFGSEIKAILHSGSFKIDINREALAQYMWYGNPHGVNTFYNGIDRLEPGHYLEISDGKLIGIHLYQKESVQNSHLTNEWDIVGNIRVKLEEAVKRHLTSDVPVGVFLSGGIDSSAITAFASKHYNGKLNTYSAAFDFAKGNNELAAAAAVAKHYGTQHHEINIKGDELSTVIETLVLHHDQPFGDAANIPLYLLTAKLKGSIKVVLQGDGGDEIFGGYSRYHTLYKKSLFSLLNIPLTLIPFSVNDTRLLQLKRFAYAISRTDKALCNALLLTMETPAMSPYRFLTKDIQESLSNFDPFKRYRELYQTFTSGTDIDKLFRADLKVILPDTFLEKVDKSTMANSIEVRVPFLDKEIVDYMGTIPGHLKVNNGVQKYLLKQALRKIVPDSILDGKKAGFGVPIAFWLQTSLHEFACNQILDSEFRHWIDKPGITKALGDHKKGRGNNGYLLWKILNLAIWVNSTKAVF